MGMPSRAAAVLMAAGRCRDWNHVQAGVPHAPLRRKGVRKRLNPAGRATDDRHFQTRLMIPRYMHVRDRQTVMIVLGVGSPADQIAVAWVAPISVGHLSRIAGKARIRQLDMTNQSKGIMFGVRAKAGGTARRGESMGSASGDFSAVDRRECHRLDLGMGGV